MSADPSSAVPILLIGGYLGAGKTTLINRLLNSELLPANTAVLVNDFGDINIDEQLIRGGSKADNVIGLANGCICCSIADDLSSALEQLRKTSVQRIVLECSGVAEPAKARQQCHYPGFSPQGCVVLVDATAHDDRCNDKYVGALATTQVQQGDLLVVTKSDLNPGFCLPALQAAVSAQDNGLIEMLLGWQAQTAEWQPIQSRSALSFTATTWSQTEVVERAPLLAYLRQLPKSVQRVKGFVRTPDGLLEVHRVDTRVAAQLRLDLSHKPPPLGLVFIGYQPEDLPQRAPSF
ncbi:MAG: GTP-binding protein [Gammaproteobacteria bacterium TMED92]|nr:MAG: GTP-binding protein [Gammaproteobacteria bacterium TMED92]